MISCAFEANKGSAAIIFTVPEGLTAVALNWVSTPGLSLNGHYLIAELLYCQDLLNLGIVFAVDLNFEDVQGDACESVFKDV